MKRHNCFHLIFYLIFTIQYSYAQFIPKTVILKIKDAHRSKCCNEYIDITPLEKYLSVIDATGLHRKFSYSLSPVQHKNSRGENYADISLIYEFQYSADIPLEKVINRLYSLGIVEYAQPHYLPKPLYTPNDQYVGSQYHLENILAFDGWDTSKGDTNIVIGIVDTGTDIDHPDLQDNIKYNYTDTIDGIDNDNDGFIDNYRGWDLGENDNDPSTAGGGDPGHHGVWVSGIAAASTDNVIGMAGTGFNCKFLPIKVNKDNGDFTMAYEGIVYAADHGCRIINCSWGSVGAAGQYEQDIINYATINKNALVIAASGNGGNEVVLYPASLNHVISVAGVDASDVKTVSSSYGIYIDVCTPGVGINTTTNGGNYGTTGAYTSFAAPIAAGCAAIIASHFPSYNALQVGEQLKVTADNIDTISGNIPFAGKLGSGRINLFRALTGTSSPSVVMTQKNITDGNDSVFTVNDTLSISGIFTNYLAPTSNLTVTLTSSSPYLNIIDSTVTLGAIATLATADNFASPFRVKIMDSIPYNVPIELKLNYNDGLYTAFEYIGLTVNPDYVNIAINDVATTITSKSRLGYNDDFQTPGLGFTYLGEQLLYEAGLMLGNSITQVSDNVRGDSGLDNDFVLVAAARKVVPPVVSDFDVQGVFNDDSAGAGKLNVAVEHKAFAWNSPGDAKYIIVEYNIINNGSGTLNGLFAGIFADWDIRDPFLNRASFDAFNKMGYVYSTQFGSPYAGIRLLTQGPVTHYAIDADGSNGSINVFDGFSTSEKFQALSSNRISAGDSLGGNDVIDVVGTGPFNLLPGDTAVVAFALLAGDDLAQLRAGAQAAQVKYNEYASPDSTTGINVAGVSGFGFRVYPNPGRGVFTIECQMSDVSKRSSMDRCQMLEVRVYDVLGREVYKAQGQNPKSQIPPKGVLWTNPKTQGQNPEFQIDISGHPAGIYHLQVITDKGISNKKVIIE